MYVCICKAVTDGQIRAAIRQGACTRKDLMQCLNVGRACGKCNADVRELLTACQAAGTSPACAMRHSS